MDVDTDRGGEAWVGLTLREAGEGDLPELSRLYTESVRTLGPQCYAPEAVEAWAAFASEARFRDLVLGRHTLVAEDRPGIVGFGGIDSSGHIASLYVRGDRARRGIGSGILAALLRHGRAGGVRRFRAEASGLARPLFEKFGFVGVGKEIAERGGVRIERYRMELNGPPAPQSKGCRTRSPGKRA